jgi:hypothetical protein
MGTRSTTHFIDSRTIDPATGKPEVCAIVYRHWDGCPKGAGRDLWHFITLCKQLPRDARRLDDPSYLSLKYGVFLADKFASDTMWKDPAGKLHKSSFNRKDTNEKRVPVVVPRKNRLNFISCGIMMADPWDIEYRYTVDCGKINPKTTKGTTSSTTTSWPGCY